MRPKSETRCFWFEDDGTSIRTGCPNGHQCEFAHPADENWDRLPNQHARPPGYTGWRDSGRRRSRDRYDSPPPRSRRSRYRSSSRSRSPNRRRSRENMDISSSPVVSRSGEKYGDRMVVDQPRTNSGSSRSVEGEAAPPVRGSSSSSSNILPTPPLPITPNLSKKLSERPPPTGPSALRNTSRALDPPPVIPNNNNNQKSPLSPFALARTDEPVPGLRVVSLKSPLIDRPPPPTTAAPVPLPPTSTPPSQPPPPTPDTSATMPPPPFPLPEVPQGLTLKIPARVAEPTLADKRKMWEERIKLFADVYRAKQDLERCEQMYKYASDISQSNFFPTLGEDDEARFTADLTDLIVKRDEVKKTHDDAVERLIQQGSWPLGPPPAAKDEKAEEERRDILRHVQELNDTAQKMSTILGDIAMKTNHPTLPVPGGDDDDDDIYMEDTVDVGDNGVVADTSGSHKRQRRSDREDVVARLAVDPDLPTREELEVYRDRLEKLEEKITDLDNELDQYQEDMNRSFKYEVENKIEEYDAKRKQQEKARREEEKKSREEEMSKVTAEAEDLENDVKEVGKEVSEVIAKIETLKIQLVEETKQRDILEAKVAQVNERLQGYIQQRESNVRTMQTLEAALKAYLSSTSQPSPPTTPSAEAVVPTSSYILSQLQEPILHLIRQHLQPMLTQSRADTEALVRERNMEIVRKIWPRMELVSRLLASVGDKLDRESTTTTPVTGPAPVLTHPMPPVQISEQQSVDNIPIQPQAKYAPWLPR